MSRVIGILSGKGGVGKTTIVANLGAALTKVFDKNVLIFDSNVSTSHLGLHLGIYEDLPVTLREVLKGKMPILNAVYIHPSGIRLIPAPLNGDGVSLTKDKCCRLVNQVRDNYDIIILDCSPGLGKEAMTQIAAIDEALIVTTPDLPALTDAIKTAQLVSKLGKKLAGIVVNRYRNEKYELTAREISSTVNYDVVGTIPEDSRIPASISKGMPAVLSYPNTPASVAIKKLAARLVGAEYHEPGLIARLKQMLDFGNASARKKAGPTGHTAPAESEVRDVQRLKEELTKEVKDELKRDIAKRVKKRLEGKT